MIAFNGGARGEDEADCQNKRNFPELFLFHLLSFVSLKLRELQKKCENRVYKVEPWTRKPFKADFLYLHDFSSN
jgi:hypothetical protein